MSAVTIPPLTKAVTRLGQALAATTRRRAAVTTYLPAGSPTLPQSMDVLHASAARADVLGLGGPASSSDHACDGVGGDLR